MKTILITGSTDGIGLETAKAMINTGHTLLIHGRNQEKVTKALEVLASINHEASIEGFVADLTDMKQVTELANNIIDKYSRLDILINNAGVFNSPSPRTNDNLDIRFVVNTIAPYYLTTLLLPIMDKGSRIIGLSSAAQAQVNMNDLISFTNIKADVAYAQSKLALTMWSMSLAEQNKDKVIVSVNPKSFLGSKMVKDAYGIMGHDLSIGADILTRAAFSDEFKTANGLYYDNDYERFSNPHPFALRIEHREALISTMNDLLSKLT